MLQDQVAVITGGAGDLGRATARRFLAEGASVVITDISANALTIANSSLGAPDLLLGLEARASDPDDVDFVVSETISAFGRLDIWVNNAGFTRDATLRKMTVEDFDAVIDVHLRGTWLGTRAAAGHMREHGGGSIVNVGSISGKVGNAGQSNYSAAKAGIIGLTKAAAKELGFAGVRVNAIQPGIIASEMTAGLSPEVRALRLADIPLGRFGEPDDVADTVLFLSSSMSRYLTGIVIDVAGGRHI